MNDLTMCIGGDCLLRFNCLRWQDDCIDYYFEEVPYDFDEELGVFDCDFYKPVDDDEIVFFNV